MLHSPVQIIAGRVVGRCRRRVCHARDAVVADRGLSERRSHEGRWASGPVRPVPAASSACSVLACCFAFGIGMRSSGHSASPRWRSSLLACTVASSRDTNAPRVDWLGAVLIGAAVAIAVAAILEAPNRGWSDPLVWGGLVAGAVHRRGVRRCRVSPATSTSGRSVVRATPVSPPGWHRSSFCSAQRSGSSISACNTCSRSWATRR